MRQIGTMLIKERNNADSGLPSPVHPLDVANKSGTVQETNWAIGKETHLVSNGSTLDREVSP